MLNRRIFCQAGALGVGALAVTNTGLARAAVALEAGPLLIEVARLDWLCNAVALTSTGRLFVGLPRWPGYEKTPAIAEVLADGSIKPFPGATGTTGYLAKRRSRRWATSTLFISSTMTPYGPSIRARMPARRASTKAIKFFNSIPVLANCCARSCCRKASCLPAPT